MQIYLVFTFHAKLNIRFSTDRVMHPLEACILSHPIPDVVNPPILEVLIPAAAQERKNKWKKIVEEAV